MARTDTLGNFLTDVADAIRTKTGGSAAIMASDFDTEIESIPSGGGGSLTMAYAETTSPGYMGGNVYALTFASLTAQPKAFILTLGANTDTSFGATGSNDMTMMRIWDGISEYATEHYVRFANSGATAAAKISVLISDTAHTGQWYAASNNFQLNQVKLPSEYGSSKDLTWRLYYFY